MTPIQQVIDRAGGMRALAGKLGVTRQAVQQWRAAGRVPVTRVLAVEACSGIPRHELRPDIYPPPTEDSQT